MIGAGQPSGLDYWSQLTAEQKMWSSDIISPLHSLTSLSIVAGLWCHSGTFGATWVCKLVLKSPPLFFSLWWPLRSAPLLLMRQKAIKIVTVQLSCLGLCRNIMGWEIKVKTCNNFAHWWMLSCTLQSMIACDLFFKQQIKFYIY